MPGFHLKYCQVFFAPSVFFTRGGGEQLQLGIDKLLANADDHLRLLRSKKEKYPPRKDGAPPGTRQDGFMAWFDSQDTAVKAALIAAIVSIIGTLATVVVAAIRRRD